MPSLQSVFHYIFIGYFFQDGTITNELHGEEEDSKLGLLHKSCGTVSMGTIETPQSVRVNEVSVLSGLLIKLVETNTSNAKN